MNAWIPIIRKHVENFDYDLALSEVKKNNVRLCDIYDFYNGENLIHCILDRPYNEASQELLNEIISFTKEQNAIIKFQESNPLQNALKSHVTGHLEFLLNKTSLLADEDIAECFHQIVEKNLKNQCTMFVKKLNPKYLLFIKKNPPSFNQMRITPLFLSIKEKRYDLFDIFVDALCKANLC